MFLVQQRCDDRIDGDGLTGTRGTGYEEVRSLGEIEHKDLVRDCTTVGDRQFHLLLVLETLGGDDRVHGNDLRFLVRYLDTDGALTRHRRDDTDTGCRKRHHDIVLQRLDLRYADTGFGYDLIQRHGRTDGRFDGLYLDAVVTKGRHDLCSVGALLLFIDDRRGFVVIDLEQVERRELEELEVFARIVRTKFLQQFIRIFGIEFILVHLFNRQRCVFALFRFLHR